MEIRFWGTRGSLAKPGRMTLRYGGNTSCVEVRGDDGTLIVLDCGTGAHGLGQALLSAGPRCDGHLMITHTHWDHIQGFPFFAPLFVPGTSMLQGHSDSSSNERWPVRWSTITFPVTLAQLAATIRPTGCSGLSGRASILIEAPSVAASKMVLLLSAKTLGGGHVVERYVCWLARLLGKSSACE